MKGVTLLVTIIWTLIILFIVFYVVAKIVAPLFWNEKTDVSYQNFLILTNKISVLESSTLNIDKDEFMFEKAKDYSLVAFDSDQTEAQTCNLEVVYGDTVARPKSCNTGEACICIYKDDPKKNNPIDCKNFPKTRFYSTALEKDHYSAIKGTFFRGCEKNTHPTTNNKLTSFFLIYNVGELFPKTKFYLEKYTKDNINHIIITDSSLSTDIRFKKINTCPAESDSGCVGKHFDQVITVGDEYEIKDEVSYCSFKTDLNKCVVEQIKKCESGFIDDACACTDFMYEDGVCISGSFVQVDVPTDYCFANKITSTSNCDAYKRNPYACSLDPCGVGGCYYKEGDCVKCPIWGKKTCDTYSKKKDLAWIRYLDSCDFDHDLKGMRSVPDNLGANQEEDNGCVQCEDIPESEFNTVVDNSFVVDSCEKYLSKDTCETDECGLQGDDKTPGDPSVQRKCTWTGDKCKEEWITCSTTSTSCNYLSPAECSNNYKQAKDYDSNNPGVCDLKCAPLIMDKPGYPDYSCVDCSGDCTQFSGDQYLCEHDPCADWRKGIKCKSLMLNNQPYCINP